MSEPSSSPPPSVRREISPGEAELLRRYWHSNLAIMAVLLVIWAVVGLGCSIVFAPQLNQFRMGGFPLGFWFAQQGSIIVFVLLILVYAILLNRLDARHHRELDAINRNDSGT